jgi:hypothetical protein
MIYRHCISHLGSPKTGRSSYSDLELSIFVAIFKFYLVTQSLKVQTCLIFNKNATKLLFTIIIIDACLTFRFKMGIYLNSCNRFKLDM